MGTGVELEPLIGGRLLSLEQGYVQILVRCRQAGFYLLALTLCGCREDFEPRVSRVISKCFCGRNESLGFLANRMTASGDEAGALRFIGRGEMWVLSKGERLQEIGHSGGLSKIRTQSGTVCFVHPELLMAWPPA